MGLQFILPVGLFTWGGIWLGRKLDLEVLFVLLGLALGFAVGFWSLYKEINGLGPGAEGSDEDSTGDRQETEETER